MRFVRYFQTFLHSITAASNWLATGGAILGCVSLLLMTFLITVDVLARYFFNSPILGVDHISAYLLVVLVFMGLGYAFKTDAHIKVDVVTNRLSKMTEHRLELVTYVVGIVGAALILWHSLRMVLTSYRMGTRFFPGAFEISAYIPQLFVPLGFGFLLLQMIVRLISKIRQK